ncbi:2-oxoglutarate dehydrogenase E2 component (dihydrolipoamide) [Babesia microti strain RI]|uniref:Dihydrolipoamide acetyltransferase component of pyruvate dehydrogenase complex n=1 Tax=Babesia microti (strain RI) TaxID=1133968 RepID=A0A1R4AA16_BABMR|nr:2-oxoglutarate dehydrogenase E2 component (dihydrolipoamide) [Babesia microti strain RI]SJK85836.1 2-oxoglutarate dehydrogenase E2 component (dihydrolipoamide) [Babesia microti strain RI]|eukprot:XP_021338052.1 2-oxoglutarate dehydrogenase E2 component (dihydrolipoamide) [Babesia microti strain RI]
MHLLQFLRFSHTMNVPALGDSISEGTLTKWEAGIGDYVHVDQPIAIVETDKVTVDINSTHSGVIEKQHVNAGETIYVGKPLCDIDTEATAPSVPSGTIKSAKTPVVKSNEALEKSKADSESDKSAFTSKNVPSGGSTRVPMSRMRMTIADRLKRSQNNIVMLTTFNECDMSNILALQSQLNPIYKADGIKLGFVSAFMAASSRALMRMPVMNAYIDGDEIVYNNFVDISVAVATENGLLVPVIRNCVGKSWLQLQMELVDVAKRARENKLSLSEMAGGTFTISNGGVYGSLMSTPIVNPPQSSILGMHSITKRPVVREDAIVIRPIMNLALSYDHRLIDGKDAVSFLCAIKDIIESPGQLLVES